MGLLHISFEAGMPVKGKVDFTYLDIILVSLNGKIYYEQNGFSKFEFCYQQKFVPLLYYYQILRNSIKMLMIWQITFDYFWKSITRVEFY